jgi:hypothetical protein
VVNVSFLKKLAAGAVLSCAVAGTALVPSAAHAWWAPGWGRPPAVVVAGPPIVYAPPPPPVVYAPSPVVVARPYRHWVHGHYTRRGFWVPAHWR